MSGLLGIFIKTCRTCGWGIVFFEDEAVWKNIYEEVTCYDNDGNLHLKHTPTTNKENNHGTQAQEESAVSPRPGSDG